VLISDLLHLVGLPFVGQVHWSEFTVSLDEEFVLKDPERAFQVLDSIPPARLRQLVTNLREAKQMLWNVNATKTAELLVTQAVYAPTCSVPVPKNQENFES
jgi:hypothetical protein